MKLPSGWPFVFVNMAVSADGKVASTDRRLTTFGSPHDERHLYELRAGADAILCGARTIEQSHSTLGNGGDVFTRRRLRAGKAKFPVRVVVSGSGSIDRGAEIWEREYGPIVVVTTSGVSAARLRWFEQHAAAVYVASGNEIDWRLFLGWLQKQYGVERVLSEGGGELNDALFRAAVVQEVHVTWCPLLIGGRRAPTMADGRGCDQLAAAAPFRLWRRRQVGGEQFLHLKSAVIRSDGNTR
jgi:riboflavin-specific deaminase-like protein